MRGIVSAWGTVPKSIHSRINVSKNGLIFCCMAAAAVVPEIKSAPKQHGLGFWMDRVLLECDRASADFAPDPVHDLRVALRRCRSMADGLMAMDPDRSWKQMKKAGKQVFSSLGELRDVHVIEEWVNQLSATRDPSAAALRQYLAGRESYLKQQAAEALHQFDRKQWKKWSVALPRRASRMRISHELFKHLALERWTEAYDLHRRVMRSPSQVAWHSLRIGIKRFRYIVENFLPSQHEAWSNDLKQLQDLLGEVHDLDVLWATALQVNVFPDKESRSHWHEKIVEERRRRIAKYREKMVGKHSLWPVWRAALPPAKAVRALALRRMKLWASMLDPDVHHSMHVSRLALQLYDTLPSKTGKAADVDERAILQVAALLHDVGLSKKSKDHHKTTRRLMLNLKPPLGWSHTELSLAAAVARYHKGALPRAGQKALTGLTTLQRRTAIRLAAILRLANAFDAERAGQIHKVEAGRQNGFLTIAAEGYHSRSRTAEAIAAARYLLETVYRCPVLVKPQRPAPAN